MRRPLHAVALSIALHLAACGGSESSLPRDVSEAAEVSAADAEGPGDLAALEETAAPEDAPAPADDAVAPPEDMAAPDPAAVLCAETGGVWIADACDCRQDPRLQALEASFDAALGCLPDPRRLCADTNGVWEGEACACAQDGATVDFEFDRRAGCAFPDDKALAADLAALPLVELVSRYASDAQRVWVIDADGVFPTLSARGTAAEVVAWVTAEAGATSEAAGPCAGPLIREALPEVACESDAGMTPTGCFLVTVSDSYDRVSALMRDGVTYGFASWSEADIAAAEREEDRILKVHVASGHRASLAFRRLAGAWVLVVIDLVRYDCAA
jgi:hypothetical protein